MAGTYGVGLYGNGAYSASTILDLSATVSMGLSLDAHMFRVQSIKSTILTDVSLEAAIHPIFSFVSEIVTAPTLEANLKVVHQWILSATIVIDMNVQANLNMEYNPTVIINVTPDIEMEAYIGPYWQKDDSAGNWVPELPVNGIWVPELKPPEPWG